MEGLKLGLRAVQPHDDMELADAKAAIVIEKIWRYVGIVLADERDELMHLGRKTSGYCTRSVAKGDAI